jgi:hypothetical protein
MKIERIPSEDECVVCGEWPEADREYLRWFVDSVPVRDVEQICDACLLAFWENWAGRPDPDEPFFFPDIEATPPLPHRRG